MTQQSITLTGAGLIAEDFYVCAWPQWLAECEVVEVDD